MLVKICGLTNINDAKQILQYNPSMLGFIFIPSSKRYISPSTALSILSELGYSTKTKTTHSPTKTTSIVFPKLNTDGNVNIKEWYFDNANRFRQYMKDNGRPLIVAVIRDLLIDEVLELCTLLPIDLLQLHGHESPTYIHQLSHRLPPQIGLIKVIQIESHHNDIKSIIEKEIQGHLLLLDSVGGGTGQSFDWHLLTPITVPYILAGGISTQSLSLIRQFENVLAVDVCSYLESQPGRKDFKKVSQFFSEILTNK